MQRKKYMIGFIFIVAISFFFRAPLQVEVTPLLADDTLMSSSLLPQITLYYSQPDGSAVKALLLPITDVPARLVPLPSDFVSYTEGFMPKAERNALLKKLRSQRNVSLHYFYNHFEDARYDVIAQTGNLSCCYFIPKSKGAVKTPEGGCPDELYINHLVTYKDSYYLLGDTMGEHSLHLYRLDGQTLEVSAHLKAATSSFVIYPHHSALDEVGQAYFIQEHGITRISSDGSKDCFIPLSFTPSYLLSHIALGECSSSSWLDYALFTPYGSAAQEGKLHLPDHCLKLVKASAADSFLYLLVFIPGHPLYTHYFLIYDLNSQKLLYCAGLHRASSYMAADFSLSSS